MYYYQDNLCRIYKDNFIATKEVAEGFVPRKAHASSSVNAFDGLTRVVKAYFELCQSNYH